MNTRRPRAQIHLPPLTGEEAHLLVAMLDRAIAAIWRAHGHDMAVFLGRDFADAPKPDADEPVHHEIEDDLF